MRQRKKMRIILTVLLLSSLWIVTAHAADTGEVYGVCEERLAACSALGETNVESDFGNLMADAIRALGDAQVGLLPSCDIGTNLQEGDITETVLEQCLQNDSQLVLTELTSQELFQILEHGISYLTLNADLTINREASHFDGYLQISGISVTYDASYDAGERVISVQLDDGTILERDDTQTVMTVVMTDGMAQGDYGYPECGAAAVVIGTERDALRAYVREAGTISAPDGDRTRIRGTRTWVTSIRTPLLIIVVLLVVITYWFNSRRHREETRSPYGFDPDRSSSA